VAKESKFLSLKEVPIKTKTKVFMVFNKTSNDLLGYVKWYAPWRQYCFLVKGDLVFNSECLTDITTFIKDLMAERKARSKNDCL